MEQKTESSTRTSPEEELSILNSKVDQVTNVEKSLLDTFAQQTLSALDSTKYNFPMLPADFFEKAERSIEQFVEEQSSLLDRLSKETHEYLNPTSRRPPEDTSVVTGETTDIVATTEEKDMDIALSGFEGDSG